MSLLRPRTGIQGAGMLSPAEIGANPAAQAGGAAVPRWFNPLNSVAIDARIAAVGFWAWRAQANDNVTWGPGPANYAASLISVEGNAAALVEGLGAVPWAAATGWGFVAAAAQWLDTLQVPNGDASWGIFIQYTAWTVSNGRTLIGAADNVGSSQAMIIQGSGANVRSYNGSLAAFRDNPPLLVAGNYAVLAKQPYRNSVAELVIPAGVSAANDVSLYIGALNLNGGALQFPTANIQAVIICDDFSAFAPADIAAIAALPAGSMHNL